MEEKRPLFGVFEKVFEHISTLFYIIFTAYHIASVNKPHFTAPEQSER